MTSSLSLGTRVSTIWCSLRRASGGRSPRYEAAELGDGDPLLFLLTAATPATVASHAGRRDTRHGRRIRRARSHGRTRRARRHAHCRAPPWLGEGRVGGSGE
ncbi:hypothetical protein BDA96_01G157500 [Sorghum bicolor]|uniref:Uncharacterized protein n=2 Tax=Sorghum bicolor TaxID=4558 RepID=A0A921RZ02_SORBI|nr:hypothetical protein BDA96_01G157500 [Sorghum bicolor]KXG37911.1 hypothetical protein SORBI_3001G150100 [Sorghum bicolor]